jgi:DNA-binding GntR family transcriptional regulator
MPDTAQPRPPLKTSIARSSPLAQQVHAVLCERLASGEMRPGERIVLEHLAEQLGVSPTPVREALNRLLQAGLVSDGPGGKLQIVSLTPSYVLDTFFVRGALEGAAAELCAPLIASAALAEMRDAFTAADHAIAQGRYDIYTGVDAYFHRTVCAIAGNAVLSQALRHLQVHVDLIRVYSRSHAGDHIRISHQEHWTVLDALQSHDPRLARQAMESHIRAASQRIVGLIDFDAQKVG